VVDAQKMINEGICPICEIKLWYLKGRDIWFSPMCDSNWVKTKGKEG